MTRALVVVDTQVDFCEGGTLAVPGGAEVAAAITALLRAGEWDHVAATLDFHRDPGGHFAAAPDFVDSWPAHCVVGTGGEAFHPALDSSRVEAVFRKGEWAAAYSGFEGRDSDGRSLGDWLRSVGATSVELVGIATDHCVRATALDAVREGFATTVLLDHTAGVASATTAAALVSLRESGVRLVGEPVLRTAL